MLRQEDLKDIIGKKIYTSYDFVIQEETIVKCGKTCKTIYGDMLWLAFKRYYNGVEDIVQGNHNLKYLHLTKEDAMSTIVDKITIGIRDKRGEIKVYEEHKSNLFKEMTKE